MRTVRKNTFETNSSSTHSLVVSCYDDIQSHINQLDNIIYDLDTKEELYEALYHVREIEDLLLKSLRELED
jgi:hypothetical protein